MIHDKSMIFLNTCKMFLRNLQRPDNKGEPKINEKLCTTLEYMSTVTEHQVILSPLQKKLTSKIFVNALYIQKHISPESQYLFFLFHLLKASLSFISRQYMIIKMTFDFSIVQGHT